ncbi:hypothetical protein ASE09_07565 [Streptomyces sp. Root66D1]|nr:hypothetical protein ASD33_07560 [Streptomyces sp. Root1304]KRA89992.1 hypothetical protein ASE09_07565 [Streptomyces sp. Root66D1]
MRRAGRTRAEVDAVVELTEETERTERTERAERTEGAEKVEAEKIVRGMTCHALRLHDDTS